MAVNPSNGKAKAGGACFKASSDCPKKKEMKKKKEVIFEQDSRSLLQLLLIS